MMYFFYQHFFKGKTHEVFISHGIRKSKLLSAGQNRLLNQAKPLGIFATYRQKLGKQSYGIFILVGNISQSLNSFKVMVVLLPLAQPHPKTRVFFPRKDYGVCILVLNFSLGTILI